MSPHQRSLRRKVTLTCSRKTPNASPLLDFRRAPSRFAETGDERGRPAASRRQRAENNRGPPASGGGGDGPGQNRCVCVCVQQCPGVHEERSEARGRGEDSARGAEGGARSDHEGTTSAHPWPSPCSFSSGESTTELMRPKLDVRVDSTTSRARDARRSAHIVHVRWYTSDEKIPSGENQCCSRAPARLL
ncbi:unnamed protein product [Prorocentrum cordatum]|uniref:Uncharacterized protein n=1 Tax=Prorocentrum cordatum TaxID=2364126 RepID=A0ABN9U057_9DINO|nr:unnamed protein product [Polarella glacialis]